MKKFTLSYFMIGFILVLLSVSVGNAEERIARWVLYGTSEMGDSYYDEISITEVNHNVIQLWNKDKYSEAGKAQIIQGRINYNLPIDGYDRLDYVTDIIELDCVNRTIKDIMFVEYDNEEKILYEYDFPRPQIKQVSPGTPSETLLKMVCPK
jgi:hypothetical protein